MNQLYRALHMGPRRLAEKLVGFDEIYTIGYRPFDPAHPLPLEGRGSFSALPFDPDWWYADPLLFVWEGRDWLFCEAFDRRAGKGAVAVAEFRDGVLQKPRVVLRAACHLSFPNVFEWNGAVYMLPETGNDRTLCLYRAVHFPDEWAPALVVPVGCELCDAILLDKTPDRLELLCSETLPENQLLVRWRRFAIRQTAEGLLLEPDSAFNAAHTDFDLESRNAGPLFALDGQPGRWHPLQSSTDIDYGRALHFRQGSAADSREVSVCGPGEIRLAGIDPARMVGVHTYCHSDRWEIVDARYSRFTPQKWLWKLRQKH